MESTTSPLSSRWWSKDTVAVVTGANKGIGYAIVRRLAELGLTVILTARNAERGEMAVECLRNSGLRVHFCCLDVSSPNSIHDFVSWFHQKFDALDILVNNAAISFNNIGENSVVHCETVIRTNYHGAKLLTDSLLPYFRRSGAISRILNITSRLGSLEKVRNPKIRALLEDDDKLSEKQISNVVDLFLTSVGDGTWETQGWPEVWTDYAVSKLALNSYSKVLAKQNKGRRLSVNCFCPGFTQTAMTGGVGKRTAQDAANKAAAIILLPPASITTGKFYAANDPSVVNSRL
uniref:(+)-neomenthol dehydrogenase n=1 Tax=Kalanchoe fedtschenkoi TaxID=63787 RepID=A0A7N0UIJ3_KALFE